MMRRHFAWPVFFLLAATSLADPIDWPADSPVSMEFGSPNAGSSTLGLVMEGADVDIRAATAGEVSFERHAQDDHTILPSALGDTIVLEGEDDMASVYGYLPGVADPGAKKLVAGSFIGKSGAAGLLDDDGFMYALYDRKSGRWVNPRVFLPKRGDSKAPIIRKVALEANGTSWNLGDQKSVPQGRYSIVVDTAEQETGISGPVIGPPWYLRVLVNGEKVVEFRTEVASVKDGVLSFYPELQGGSNLVDGDGSVELPPRLFARGKVSIEVLVRDYAGNERSAAWTLNIE